jgi:hypothetical protein
MENPYLESRTAVVAGPFYCLSMIFSKNRIPLFRTTLQSRATLAQSSGLGNAKSLAK